MPPRIPAPYTPPNAPQTPLMRKAARLVSFTPPQFDITANSPIHDRTMLSFPLDSENLAPISTVSVSSPKPPSPSSANALGPSPGRIQYSIDALEAESHATRLKIRAKEQEDKGTSQTYERHFRSYQAWWDSSEAAKVAQNSRLAALPAMPITAAKVSMFLAYESTREKKKRGAGTIAGSSVGQSQISGVITALESFRFNSQHTYKHCAEAQIPLRNDSRVRQFESAAKHDEPKRAEKAQITKAAGSSLDTYTVAELRKCASWCLTNFSGSNRIYLGLRDRAMLLLGAGTAFRGDSTRILLWSDLFKTSIPLGDDSEAPVFGLLADNAKHNQTGRIDEHGVLRHKHVELCGIGAVAMMMFGYFHIMGYAVPDFSPDFSDKSFGEHGQRDWYTYHVFSTGIGREEMSYQAHHDRVMQMHAANDVSITKVTHGARPFAAQTCRSFGASVSDTKALGGWNESGSFKNCYDRALPVGALLGAAFFNSLKPELYRVARDILEPPDDVSKDIFPWIEDELAALISREHSNRLAKDIALRQFLSTMLWFRRILVQDLAVIFTQNPHALIFKYAPFNSPSFRNFAASSTAAIDAAEETARLAFQNLPQHLVASLQGALATQNLAFERERQNYHNEMASMRNELGQMKTLLELVAGTKRVKRVHGNLTEGLSDGFSELTVITDNSAPKYPTPPSFDTADMPFDMFPPDPALDAFIAASFTHPNMPMPATSPQAAVLHTPVLPLPSTTPQLSTLTPGSPEERQQFYFQRYGADRFRKHSPEWVDGDWLPRYKYSSADGIWEYWVEWKEGVDGFISVEELTTTWGAKWRRNTPALKNENTRRMRVVNLILELCQKPRWNVSLVQRFITDRYARQFRARAFSDYLKNNRDVVIAAAANYP
ncbi:hypothetical protein R3P38DRAFT_3190769 [Favolaschia claudopus]|uniref:Transcription activator GCR1-like domain-containing protein n=1 Tax=Favolaschia claudopus TaxID=2862362 RepID=A0AAW0BMT0_9AGAR